MKNQLKKNQIISPKNLLSLWMIAFFMLLFVTVKATTYTVVNNNDAGVGSLRQAILDANANAGPDVIDFNIPGSTLADRTIFLASDLPDLMGTVVIDGTTQPNGATIGVSDAKIVVDGGLSNHIFILEAINIEIYGIYMKDSDTRLYIASAFTGCIIGAANKGNVIAGTDADGIRTEADNTVIKGNFIGIEPNGVTLRANDGHGIYVRPGAANNIIGGSGIGERNIISGNTGDGIRSQGANVIIERNFIGTDFIGTTVIANDGDGIYLDLGNDADLATIDSNVISGNNGSGIFCANGSILVTNNFIGTDLGETLILGNTNDGFSMNSGSSATVEVTDNTISNNGGSGIYDYNGGMIVKGNFIGTNSAHTLDLGNGNNGIYIRGNNCIVGGFAVGEQNIIAYNGQIGVGITSSSNSITNNIIHHNEEEGVDLVGNGNFNLITQNSFYCNALSAGQPKGIDIQGGNEGLQAPVLVVHNATTISGTSAPNVIIELFVSDTCDHCEGVIYLGSDTSDASGNWSFSGTFSGNHTTTATNVNNSTSEFSEGIGCGSTPPPPPIVGCCGDGICDPGENCPWDCNTGVTNCPNTIGSFYDVNPYINNFSGAVSAGYSYTLYPPFQDTVCFEYLVPSTNFSIQFNIQGYNGSSTIYGNGLQLTANGGCISNNGISNGLTTGSLTYDENCNLLANQLQVNCAGINVGQISSLCYILDVPSVNSLDSIVIVAEVDCGGSCQITSAPPTGCPPFNYTTYTESTCIGVATGVAAIIPDCGTHFTYLWDDPTVQTTDTAINLSAGTHNVIVTNTAYPTCKDTISLTVDSTICSIDVTGNDTIICKGSCVDLIATATNTVGSVTYTWSPNVGAGAGPHNVCPTITTNYIVSIIDSLGLTATDTIKVTVDSVTTSNNIDTICMGTSVLLGGVLQTTSGTYIDTIFGGGANGCDSIIITELTVVSLTTNSASIGLCDEGTGAAIFDLTTVNNTVNGGTSDSVSWFTNSLATLPIVNTTAFSSSSDTVYAIVTNGICSDTIPVELLVNQKPLANYTIESSFDCNGAYYTITNTSTNATSYQWYLDGSFISSDFEPVIIAENGNNNQLLLVSSVNNCQDSIQKLVTSETIKLIIPNVFTPNNDNSNDVFQSNKEMRKCLEIEIFNRWGQLIFKGDKGVSWDGKTTSGELASEGTYFYLVRFGEEIYKGTVTLLR